MQKERTEKFKDTYGILQLLSFNSNQKNISFFYIIKKLQQIIQSATENIWMIEKNYFSENPFDIYYEIFWEINYSTDFFISD